MFKSHTLQCVVEVTVTCFFFSYRETKLRNDNLFFYGFSCAVVRKMSRRCCGAILYPCGTTFYRVHSGRNESRSVSIGVATSRVQLFERGEMKQTGACHTRHRVLFSCCLAVVTSHRRPNAHTVFLPRRFRVRVIIYEKTEEGVLLVVVVLGKGRSSNI